VSFPVFMLHWMMEESWSERGTVGGGDMVWWVGMGVLDCTITYILLIIEHNGDVSPENSSIWLDDLSCCYCSKAWNTFKI